MIVDVHAHIGGPGNGRTGNYVAPGLRRSMAFRRMGRRLGFDAGAAAREGADETISSGVMELLRGSVVDRAVFLALDAAYDEDGARDDARTQLVTDNDFVADLTATHPKALFGASVHPFRRDALRELERVAARGACLVKWLPSAQNIRSDDRRCFEFYEALAHHGLPLLCHAGREHTVGVFSNDLNDPARLRPALERGVTVIAAHCGAALYLHERSYLKEWRAMALRYERFYGDISAFGIVTRLWNLRGLLESRDLTAKLVYGSDFPATPMPWTCVGSVGWRAAWTAQQTVNPFDQPVALMQSAGVPEEVFARAGSLLRTGIAALPASSILTGARP